MHSKHYSKQMEKRERITEHTMVVATWGKSWAKAEQVFTAAAESVGLKTVGKAVAMYLEEIKRSDARRKALEREMKELLKDIPLAEYIQSLPGMGKVSCAVFLGELGNPDHFGNPRQIISKKGRWLLRKCLYFVALNVVQRSSFFEGDYEHKKKGLDRPLEKKEAICAVILKLIRVLFALMRNRRMFAEELPRYEKGVTGGDARTMNSMDRCQQAA